MAGIITLRVGICSCSSVYHSRLQGQTFDLADRRFIIHEVYIFEGNQDNALKGTRCHFFLDTHYFRREFEVDLSQIVFVSNGKDRGWKMFVGGCAYYDSNSLKRGWKSRRRPATSEIVNNGMKRLLGRMNPSELEHWLAISTPLMCR